MNHVPTELDVRVAQQGGDERRAAELAYRLLSRSVERFLYARLASQTEAEEACSRWREMLVQALPSFEWRSSLRTFAYTLARRARPQAIAARGRRPAEALDSALGSELADRGSFETLNQIASEERARALELRATLDDEDQELIALYAMYRAVHAKFQQHADIRDVLLGTEDAKLVELSGRDRFWAVGPNGEGENWLGRVLMRVRQELRIAPTPGRPKEG